MIKIFKYKQKIFIKILILLFFIFFPLVIMNDQLYFSFMYYLIFFLIQIIIHLYYSSKRLIINEHGIEKKILWIVMTERADWKSMEEVHEIVRSTGTSKSSMQSMMESFPVIKWFAERGLKSMIKIIITNNIPIYIKLKEIKKSTDLYNILKEKIRFV